jgi:hypothetical protein
VILCGNCNHPSWLAALRVTDKRVANFTCCRLFRAASVKFRSHSAFVALCVATDLNSVLLVLLLACMSVSIVTGLRAGLSGVRIPAGARDLSFYQNAQTSSGAPPAFISICTGGSLLRDKTAGV